MVLSRLGEEAGGGFVGEAEAGGEGLNRFA